MVLFPPFPVLPVRRLKFVQGAAQRFQLAFVRDLLVLGQFHQPQNLLHLLQRLLQRFDDVSDFPDNLADGRTVGLDGVRDARNRSRR